MMLPTVAKKLSGFNLIAHKMFSLHPDDWYLSIVLCERIRPNSGSDFVVWTYNCESGGFGGGHYTNCCHKAITNFNERGGI